MATKITNIGITNDKISGRGGISLFLKYIINIGAIRLISSILTPCLNLGGKGLTLEQFLKQIFAFFIDGTDMSISSFDNKKKDTGYAAVLENDIDQMASSHQIKRFFSKLSFIPSKIYSLILHELFIKSLKESSPSVIKIGIDTMVMDNDDADQREGCEPTYKKKKGFQPLHICWGRKLIDVIFRKGSAHSNHGTDFTDRVTVIVNLIRKRYSQTVPIVLCADSGFADQKAFKIFEKLGVSYIIVGKMYKDFKEYKRQLNNSNLSEYSNGNAVWKYYDFGNKLKSWNMFRRCIYTKLHRDKNGQCILDFASPNVLIYTNIGMGGVADERLKQAGANEYFQATTIIEESHNRGADELIHRSLKELATKEQLPFKNFGMNRAYYFMMVISHTLLEISKEELTEGIIPVQSYPNTFRRKIIDIAVKIVSSARRITMKVNKETFDSMEFETLWQRCQNPTRFCLALPG